MIIINDVEILNALVEFLKENISKHFQLKKPPVNNKILGDYELVNIAIYKGWVPPKNYLEEYGYDIPGIIVMLDEGIDDSENAEIAIRLKVITYDPGKVKEDKTLSPNVEGYVDLLNVITRIRMELSKNPIILNKVNVNKPIRWSMDKEQSYPYWSADVSFNVSIAPFDFEIKNGYERYL